MSGYDSLTKNEKAHFHDVVYEADGVAPSVDRLLAVYESLPVYILDDVQHWGLSDTCVRDGIYSFIKQSRII